MLGVILKTEGIQKWGKKKKMKILALRSHILMKKYKILVLFVV